MPICSMTGFGQAREQSDIGTVTVEMKTVNHRYAEVVVRSPKELVVLEELIRQHVKQYLARGRMDIYITLEPGMASNRLQIDWTLLEELQVATDKVRTMAPDAVPATLLEWLQFPGVLRGGPTPSAEDLRELVLTCVDVAVTKVFEMRQREGGRLASNLTEKLQQGQELLQELKQRAPQVVTATTERLQAKVYEVTTKQGLDEARLLTEIAVLADKVAIDEEITRLSSHMEEFTVTLDKSEPVGRRLDFIIQEMNREVNTIASKSPDLNISRIVVDLKTMIEQMREQVQNIE